MTIEQIGKQQRVPVKRDECGDKIIRGINGHLYVDEGKPFVCFTDDGRKKPFTKKQKTHALRKLTGIVHIKQEGDFEFIAQIKPEAIATALFRVLRVRRFMVTKGTPRPLPEALIKSIADRGKRRLRADISIAGALDKESCTPTPKEQK